MITESIVKVLPLEVLQSGNTKRIKRLIKQSIDLGATANGVYFYAGATPLFFAAMWGQPEVVRELLQFPGIDVNTESPGGSPLSVAADNGHLEVVRALLEFPGIKVNAITYIGSALCAAARRGHIKVVRALLECTGIAVNLPSEVPEGFPRAWSNRSPLFFAAQNGHIEVVHALLQSPGIDVNFPALGQNNNLVRPFFVAVTNKHFMMALDILVYSVRPLTMLGFVLEANILLHINSFLNGTEMETWAGKYLKLVEKKKHKVGDAKRTRR